MDILVKNSSDVRKQFGSFVDDVIYKSPQFVKRNRDRFMSVNLKHLDLFLSEQKLHVTLECDEDGSYIATFAEIEDLIGSGETEQDAIFQLAEDLLFYAQDFLQESFHVYVTDVNRKKHLPILLKVIMQDNIQGIIDNLLDVKHT